jgi:hypothetical protein
MQAQIAATHLELIQCALAAQRDASKINALASLLDDMHEHGWLGLTHTLRQRFNLPTTADQAAVLDDEDRAILELLELAAAQPDDFAALATQTTTTHNQHAAQALAAVVYAATLGEREALETLAELHQAADTPAALATSAALISMIEGERNAETLCHDLPAEQSALIAAVLGELHKLEA